MTDSIKSVSETQGTAAGGHYSGSGLNGDHRRRGHQQPQADLVEISSAAREQSKGKSSKNIIDYLKELFG
jgi:hypothetical protein